MDKSGPIKAVLALGLGISLLAVIYWLRDNTSVSVASLTSDVGDEQSSINEVVSKQSERRAATGNPKKYKNLYDTYSASALANDPVGINKFLELTGACESVSLRQSGVEVPVEMQRLRSFCATHSSDDPERAYLLNELWPSSYSMRLKSSLEALEAAGGKDAVARQISAELRTADAYQAQMALEYAANAGVIPEELSSVVDKSDASWTKQLSILSHIEFCRRGGDCTGADLKSLSACVALPPCPTELGLLEVIRRSSPPRDYEAAMKMSEVLRRGR